jgi:riboflavin synthase
MFSGIIRSVGRIEAVREMGGDCQFTIGVGELDLDAIGRGDSVAVNGVCLTAVEKTATAFLADVSGETLRVTTLGGLAAGDPVNLEPSLALGDKLDGHLVSGHVDGVGQVAGIQDMERSVQLAISVPEALARYVARKGSVAVDGVSLTVNSVSGARFEVNIVPHTQTATIISGYQAGTAVNIEVDLIARYLERLSQAGASPPVPSH